MENNKSIGICKLCLQEHYLVKSHIIPKFFWKQLKEKYGHYNILSENNFDNKKYQKDLTENLFCEHCDTVILSRNEKYLADFLFNKEFEFRYETISKSFSIIYNLDYKLIKIGLLSILWRMSLSNYDIFKLVKLGDKHNEIIRRYIINNEDVKEDIYPIFFTVPLMQGKYYKDFILQPEGYRENGNIYYRCILGGFIFIFVVGSSRITSLDNLMTIKENGSWVVLFIEIDEINFLKNFLGNVSKTLNEAKIVQRSD